MEYGVWKGLVDCFVWVFVERNEAFGGRIVRVLVKNGWDCHFRSFSLLLIVLYSPSVYFTKLEHTIVACRASRFPQSPFILMSLASNILLVKVETLHCWLIFPFHSHGRREYPPP